jgi:ParB-like chromosome segregation protein Spo0J
MQHQIAKQIILQPVEALIPYARNSRTHSDEQVAQIAASIREFGFTNPVLVDDEGGIVAGHGRVMAARQIGMTAVPTINVGWLSEQQRRAYVIADNQLAMNAGWDESVLSAEMDELKDMGFDIELLGFDAEALSALLDANETEGGSGTSADEKTKGNLSDRFMIPPFTVLNAREGWWQNRKRAWLAIGIKSELGRGDATGTAAPGGGLLPAMKQAGHINGSKTVRGNGAGRPIA